MKDISYTISHPISGEQEDFASLKDANKSAKQQDYTPVFIDFYSEEEAGIVHYIQINNRGKKVI